MKQKRSKSLGINAFLNAFKNGLSVIFPLITYPYAFRILHADGIGRVNYANSIVSYFMLIATLGISTYATREGAKVRDNEYKLNQFVSQIFSINIITTVIAYVGLFICLLSIDSIRLYKELIIISSISIVFTTFGVEWINNIYEDFLFITIRSIIINLISLILLFVLVKTPNDYYYYALLTVISNGLICLSNWIYCRKYVHIKLTSHIDVRRHIKPILTMFANAIAVSLYVNSDTTMLGWMLGVYVVGLYEISVKIYSVVKRMLAAVYIAIVPRLSFYVGKGDTDKVKKTYTSLFSNLTILLLPASMGIFVLSKELILIMGGSEYLESVPSLMILSIGLIGAIFGGTVTYCLNIPLGRENVNVKATVLGAILNIGLNFIAIPLFKQNGAAITTAFSEFFVFFYCVFSCKDFREYFEIKTWKKNFFHALIGCVSIVIISFIVHIFEVSDVLNIIFIIAISVIVYAVELILLKNESAILVIDKILMLIYKQGSGNK